MSNWYETGLEEEKEKDCRLVHPQEDFESGQEDFESGQEDFESGREECRQEECWHWEKGNCLMGENCKFSHTHKDDCGGRCGGTRNCRIKPCTHWDQKLWCPFGDKCTFAHVQPCNDFMRGDCDGTECSEGSHPKFFQNKDVCRRWKKFGKCALHEKGMCKFSHSTKHQGECRFHKKGVCIHHDKCTYYHS